MVCLLTANSYELEKKRNYVEESCSHYVAVVAQAKQMHQLNTRLEIFHRTEWQLV